jgi:hypothetical protein
VRQLQQPLARAFGRIEKRTYGCQPGVSRADAIGSLLFDMVKEGKNDWRIEVLDIEDCRLDTLGVTNKSQE